MPQPRTMKALEETMQKQGIPDDVITKLNFPEAKSGDDVLALTNQMSQLLTKEQCLAVMEEHGCCKSGKRDIKSKAIGKELGNKPISDKVGEAAKLWGFETPAYINDKGDLVLELGCYIDGNKNNMLSINNCACPPIYNNKNTLPVSHIFCGCCAGHHKHHWQNMLGVKLKLKSIELSSNKTEKGYPRVFIYKLC
jgi:hypothetical protein